MIPSVQKSAFAGKQALGGNDSQGAARAQPVRTTRSKIDVTNAAM